MRSSSLLLIVSVLLLVCFILGCLSPGSTVGSSTFQPGLNSSKPNTKVIPGISGNDFRVKTTASYGDIAYVRYILWIDNGTMLETNIESVAKSYGTYQDGAEYSALKVPLKNNSGFIDGFVNGIIGLKVGDKTRVVIPPEQAYGVWSNSNVRSYLNNRTYDSPLIQYVSIAEVQSSGVKNVSIGKIVKLTGRPWLCYIKNFSGNTVEIEQIPMVGNQIMVNGIPQTVVSVGNTSFKLRLDPVVNQTYSFQTPTGTTHKLLSINDTHMVFDENHPLAGETLTFDIELESLS